MTNLMVFAKQIEGLAHEISEIIPGDHVSVLLERVAEKLSGKIICAACWIENEEKRNG